MQLILWGPIIKKSEVNDHDFLLLINMYSQPVSFSVPLENNQQWQLIIDTAAWAETNCNYWSVAEANPIYNNYQVNPFSIVVLEQYWKLDIFCLF